MVLFCWGFFVLVLFFLFQSTLVCFYFCPNLLKEILQNLCPANPSSSSWPASSNDQMHSQHEDFMCFSEVPNYTAWS